MRQLAAASLVCLAACAFEPSGPGDLGPADPGPGPDDPLGPDAGIAPPTPPPGPVECRVDGPNLGVVGLIVEVPGQGSYRFESWQTLVGGELVGFTLSGPAGVRYEVRADEDRFWASTLLWSHPDLPADADAISRIDFCAQPPDGDGGGG